MRGIKSVGVAAALIAGTGPASARIWIGQVVGNMIAAGQAARQEHDCMMGTPVASSELEETRGYTAAAMAAYGAAVAKGAPADTRAAWNDQDTHRRWVNGETELRGDKLAAIADPFAAAGARIDATPVAYVRSGDGKLVEGRWQAHDSAGRLVGTYDGLFSRAAGVWKLRTLTLLSAADTAEGVIQFCHKTGDVAPYKEAYEERQQILEAKRAAKAERRAAQEAARARKSGSQ